MNLNNLVQVEDVKQYLREILKHADDDSDDAKLIAVFKLCIELGVKCKPCQKDPLVRLLELMGYVRVAKQSGIIITERHHFDLMHDSHGGSWTMGWHIDPQEQLSRTNIGTLELEGEFQPFTRFSLMWDLAPEQEVFNSIRIDEDVQDNSK